MFLTFTARFMYFTSKLALDRRPINIFLYFHRTVKAKRPNLALGQLQFKSCPSKKVFSGEFAGNISVGSDGSGTRKFWKCHGKIGLRQVKQGFSSFFVKFFFVYLMIFQSFIVTLGSFTLKNHQI